MILDEKALTHLTLQVGKSLPAAILEVRDIKCLEPPRLIAHRTDRYDHNDMNLEAELVFCFVISQNQHVLK